MRIWAGRKQDSLLPTRKIMRQGAPPESISRGGICQEEGSPHCLPQDYVWDHPPPPFQPRLIGSPHPPPPYSREGILMGDGRGRQCLVMLMGVCHVV